MNWRKTSWLILYFAFTSNYLFGQHQVTISGTVSDRQGNGVSSVNVRLSNSNQGTVSGQEGNFNFTTLYQPEIRLEFSHLQYKKTDTLISLSQETRSISLQIVLDQNTFILEGVTVGAETDQGEVIREKVSVYKIDPKNLELLATPFGEFNKVLATLPGVVSNNELSSAYSVRGGNFDENLVYINNIQVYRPFLIRAGQQEGLSIINPDLVSSIEFSAGGWQPRYGDKLSSSLNIEYKKPDSAAASMTLGLLGGSLHMEGKNRKGNISAIVGARHKRAGYLLSTQEVQGGYRPRFTDIQSAVRIVLDKEQSGKTEINTFLSYADNKFIVTPEFGETNFGLPNLSLRLRVAFDGRETLNYQLWQGGVTFKHIFSNRFKSELIVSGMQSTEREYFDLEGGYLLCDVNMQPGDPDFNECVSNIGVGSNYDYGRNKLDAQVLNVENRSVFVPDDKNTYEFGIGYSYQGIEDKLDEFSFLDSAGFARINHVLDSEQRLYTHNFTAYLQHGIKFNAMHSLVYGLRLNYRDGNDQLLVSPRIQYSLKPLWQRDIIFKFAAGVYQQPPFYRELRDFDGSLNIDLKAQTSFHFIAGMDYNLNIWGRPFKFISEAYYKYATNVVAYDVDNVKIRYYANNDSKAYAAGLDMRISGEFVPGTESWFSLGILSTKEDLAFDNRGWVRRPSDQRINFGVFFTDHIPNDPSLRVNLNLLFGTGLPFGPPNDINTRNVFNGSPYRRVDIGFSKIFSFHGNGIKSLWLGLDILNILGARNTISYTWVPDFNGLEFGVPNHLSQRFFNLKFHIKI